MRIRTSIRSALALLISVAVCAASVPAFADVSTSTSFTSTNQAIDSFGGDATSSSFYSVMAGDTIITGDATSSSFQLAAGPLYYDTFEPISRNWRWYDDDTNETPASALEAENVAPTNIGSQNIVKLRLTVIATSSISAEGVKFKAQYSTASDFSSNVYDVTEQGTCNGNSTWCYADGAGIDNGIITTKTLSDADACSGSVGSGCGTHNESGVSTSTFVHVASAATEYEFTIKPVTVAPNTVYFFRLYYVPGEVGVPLDSGASYPSLSTSGTDLTFSINGLPSATTTEGVTTDINTSSEGVAFGALPLAISVIAAQRLTVSTNATQGYQIYTYARQGLLGSGGQEIEGVAGTNALPSGWSSGCGSGAPGCFGYHAGDDVLSGGSVRFAPNDTYAQFSTTTPNEIAYSSTPATNRSTDVVYRVEARGLQDAGDYSTEVVYIVVPTF